METEPAIFHFLFEPCSQYKLGSYAGKHVWENHTGIYISTEQFLRIMSRLGHTQKATGHVKGLFKFRQRKARHQLGTS